MALRVSENPYGYRELLVYKKAEEMQKACAEFTNGFVEGAKREKGGGGLKTILALQDQMDRSARSVKQNIVEGWKRNGTQEYHQFLGFSLGANAELEEDCNDIVKGFYKGIEREKGEKWEIQEVEKLPFYPLNSRLPLLVQLKLRCKELNFLLQKLQQSLSEKMKGGARVMGGAWGADDQSKKGEEWLQKAISGEGLVRAADGRLVKRKEGGKGEKREERRDEERREGDKEDKRLL